MAAFEGTTSKKTRGKELYHSHLCVVFSFIYHRPFFNSLIISRNERTNERDLSKSGASRGFFRSFWREIGIESSHHLLTSLENAKMTRHSLFEIVLHSQGAGSLVLLFLSLRWREHDLCSPLSRGNSWLEFHKCMNYDWFQTSFR